MTTPRYLLITLLALAGCQTAPRGATDIGEAPGEGTLTTALVGQAGAQTPALQPLTSADATGAARANVDSDEAKPSVNEPRIVRGNDKLFNPPKAFPPIEGAPVSLAFEEAPVAEVVRTMLGDILKVNYVLHPPLAGNVTLITRQPVAPDQAVFLLESALQANGLALMRDVRGTYHVGRPDALRSIGGSVRQVVSGQTLAPGYGAIIVPLQYIGAAEMAAILKPMLPGDALVRVDSLRNLLVLSGTRTQAEGWLELVNTFDVDLLKGMSVGVFPLKYASIQEVEAALALVSGASGGGAAAVRSSGAARPGAPGAAAQAASSAGLGEGSPLFGAIRILPIERLNSILVVTPRAEYLDEARRWIERLDQPSENGGERQLFIYKVQNVDAKHLSTVLSGIFGGQGAVQAARPANSGIAPGLGGTTGSSFGQTGINNAFGNSSNFGGANRNIGGLGSGGFGIGNNGAQRNNFGQGAAPGQQQAALNQGPTTVDLGGVRVIADDLNNSVLVWSTKAEYEKIESTLKRLDLPLTQVLIEASIVEVTLNNNLEYGLEWAFNDSRSKTDYTGRGTLFNAPPGGSPLATLSNGFSYALSSAAGDIRAVLKAVAAKTSVKVLASPTLMVLDNHTASINVGTQTPIKAGETISGTGFVSTNIQYKDTGVQLMVTPSVNSGNIVTMQVDQSVTDVGAPDAVTSQRAFLQRQISSKVAVRSGQAIVMGGLIQERSTTGKSGIPFLNDIPVLGNLFGSTTSDGARTELIVVITPRVVRSDVDIKKVTDDLRDSMQGLKAIQKRDQRMPETSAPTQTNATQYPAEGGAALVPPPQQANPVWPEPVVERALRPAPQASSVSVPAPVSVANPVSTPVFRSAPLAVPALTPAAPTVSAPQVAPAQVTAPAPVIHLLPVNK